MKSIKCKICGNNDLTSIYEYKGHIVCKKCIHYQRDALLGNEFDSDMHSDEIFLDYPLSLQQVQCSAQILQSIQNQQDVLLRAVCGAGKTEMLLESIAYILKNKGKVGFVIPRRQVVLEVADRLRKNFKNAKVVSVCGGYLSDLNGDIIVLTAHQAIRYPHYFDLVILDECDAFPYKNNEILENIVHQSIKGNIVYSTATPNESLLTLIHKNKLNVVELNNRYTLKPLSVPVVHVIPQIFIFNYLIFLLKNTTRQCLIFFPTIQLTKRYYHVLKHVYKCNYITSLSEDKEIIIDQFRQKEIRFLLTTSILERGVTFIDIDVIVVQANHPVFDLSSLIQISGRVGRHPIYFNGNCTFIVTQQSTQVNQCIERIQYANQSLSMVSK